MPFDKALEQVLKDEGGYVNDPIDSGGETFRGVSRNNNPNWRGWKLIDEAKAKGHKTASQINAYFKNHAEMASIVAEIYRKDYYEPFNK